jgi:hypothetical protein
VRLVKINDPVTKQRSNDTVRCVKSRERWALVALALTGWSAAGWAAGGLLACGVALCISCVVIFKTRERPVGDPKEPERPKSLADLHHILPEGFSYEQLPGIDKGHLKLDAYVTIEDAVSQARETGCVYIVTCNGGGRVYGYLHTQALFDITEALDESFEENVIQSDMSVWRARRLGVMIPKGKWQTVGGWICEIAGWGVLQEGELNYENWQIKTEKNRGRGYSVTLKKAT